MTRLNGTPQFLQSTLASMGKRKKKQASIFIVLIFVWGGLLQKNQVSKVLSFYLEQTTCLRKFPQLFVSVDIDTLGQTCPKAPCLNGFLYEFLIGILSQEGQIRAPVVWATTLAVDSVRSILCLETCKTATQSLFLQTFDKWPYSDCVPHRLFFLFFFWISAKTMVFPQTPDFCFVLFAFAFCLP